MKLDFAHLSENKTTYIELLFHAWIIALVLIIHGIFPFVLTKYASDKIMNASKKTNEVRKPSVKNYP